MTQHLDLKQSKLLSSCDQSRDTTPTTPEESNYSLTNFGQIPRSSSVRIEDKLFQKQVGANRRLEELRKKLETEEMQKLQEKPKISKRTKELAKKADLRYFEQLFTMNIENNQQFECEDIENLQRKNTQKEKIVENNCIKPIKIERSRKSVAFIEQNQTQNPTKSLHLNTEVTTRKESPELSPIRYEIKPLRKQKRKRQSLLDLSAADRSKVWLQQKQNKIETKLKVKEESSMEECTFKPVIHPAPKNLKSVCYSKQFMNSKGTSSNSSFVSYEAHKRNTSDLRSEPSHFASLSNYVNVSFKSGCNIDELILRSRNI